MRKIDYTNCVMCAPMVRVSTFPFRLLAQSYGADIVFSEELIDKKLVKCTRIFNDKKGTFQHILDQNGHKKVVYQNNNDLKIPKILHIGTSDNVNALNAAKNLYFDYDGLDINMGCPKKFSVQGGMGIALLKNPVKIKDILTTLVRNLNKPVSCKVRIFEDKQKTIQNLKLMESCGVKNITIHARYPNERPTDPAHPDLIKDLISGINIPVCYNGDIFNYDQIEDIKKQTGCSSVMIARGALYNCSIFSSELEDKKIVAKNVLKKFSEYDYPFQQSKYVLKRMYEMDSKGKVYKDIVKSKIIRDLENIFLDEERHYVKEPDSKRAKTQ